jgi:hypothetical protein
MEMDVCFVELEAFTEEVLRVADEDTLRQFEAELLRSLLDELHI